MPLVDPGNSALGRATAPNTSPHRNSTSRSAVPRDNSGNTTDPLICVELGSFAFRDVVGLLHCLTSPNNEWSPIMSWKAQFPSSTRMSGSIVLWELSLGAADQLVEFLRGDVLGPRIC